MVISLALAVLVSGVLCHFGLWLTVRFLARRKIFDRPNDRSSHTQPTPRGGGLAIIPAILIVWAAIAWDPTAWFGNEIVPGMGWIIGGAVILGVISWIDDLRGLSPLIRFATHGLAIGLVLWAVPMPAPVFQGILPVWLDIVATAILWLWFVNLFNFMDGIDGISGVEVVAISSGIGAAFLLTPVSDAQILMAGALGGAAFSFLRWNWSPAKIFLGDVGSVPLGFLLGWLLLQFAAAGQWAAALILPAYYLADATITLLRRAWRREKIWQAHRQHFYQQAAQNGMSHAQISKLIALANGGLIICAGVAAAGWIFVGVVLAVAVVTGLLWRLNRTSQKAETPAS